MFRFEAAISLPRFNPCRLDRIHGLIGRNRFTLGLGRLQSKSKMSLKVATISNIPIRLNITLLIVVGLFTAQLGWLGLPAGFILFSSILLHELGHALVAQRLGLRITGIDLHLLGGVAQMAESPKSPKDEALIAAAGPAVSFVLAGLFFVLTWATGMTFNLENPTLMELLPYAAGMNLMLGLFNLVPALPMDGGRIFRALLSSKMGQVKGTEIAAKVSRVFAVIFVVVAIANGSWSLGLIGVMLFMMAKREVLMARAQAFQQQSQPYFRRWFPGAESRSAGGPVVIDVTPVQVNETHQIVEDAFGRRYVRVVRHS